MNLRGWLTALAMLIGLGLVGGAVMLLTAEEEPEPVTGEVETDYVSSPELHTDEEVEYAETPPMGGDHANEWLACGVYDQPVREENAVHALEHGVTWITYDPSMSAEDVAKLVEAAPEHRVISPYEGLPSQFVVTVWNHQLRLEDIDDPRLEEFIDKYGDGRTAAEWQLACQGGVEEFED